MEVKRIYDKRLGLEISELGFGIMRMPTLENGKIDWELSTKMLDRAYQAGINYFDTAYPYHGGESQILLGETLKKYPRDSYYYVTKLPMWMMDSKEALVKVFNEQFTNCRMDYFDFYMMHGLGEDRYHLIDEHGIYDYLQEQKKAGRIKYLGFSYHGDYETFKKLFDNYKWDFAMIQYNYVDDIMLGTGKYYDIMLEHDVPCMVMEPVRGSYLASPPKPALEVMEKFEGDKYSPAAWALRWCRDKQNVAVTISGMSTMEQLEENIRTFALSPDKLTDAEAAMLVRARDIMLETKIVPCTYCGYCSDCPGGVNISKCFEAFNQFKLFPNEFRAGLAYGKLARSNSDYTACTNCGFCLPLCPQKIDIPTLLKPLHEELEPLRQKFAP